MYTVTHIRQAALMWWCTGTSRSGTGVTYCKLHETLPIDSLADGS